MKKTLLYIVTGILLVAAWSCSGGGGDGSGANVGVETDPDTVGNDDTYTLAYMDDYVTCVPEDTYDEEEITCYVDSVNGNDMNNGLSEAYPVKSQSAIDTSCTVVRFKRGSVFNEKLGLSDYLHGNVKVYTNYGPKSDPLPHFKVSSEPGRGPVVLSFSPLTIDGLHLSGARGDNTMVHDFDNDGDGITEGIVGGIGAFLGAATIFIHNEVDDCESVSCLAARDLWYAVTMCTISSWV